MYDAVHHSNRGKCDAKNVKNYGSYRRRRNVLYDALAAEFEEASQGLWMETF